MACTKSKNKNSGTLSLGCRPASWFQTKQWLFLPLHGKSQVTSLKRLQLLESHFLFPEVNNRLPEQISELFSCSASSSSSSSWQSKLRTRPGSDSTVLGLLRYLSPHASSVQPQQRHLCIPVSWEKRSCFYLQRAMEAATARRHSTLKYPTE